MEKQLKETLQYAVIKFITNQKGYFCYSLDVSRLSDNDLMTAFDIVSSHYIPAFEKRRIMDGMTIRLQIDPIETLDETTY